MVSEEYVLRLTIDLLLYRFGTILALDIQGTVQEMLIKKS